LWSSGPMTASKRANLLASPFESTQATYHADKPYNETISRPSKESSTRTNQVSQIDVKYIPKEHLLSHS